MTLDEILRDTYIYQHDVAEGREEERQARLQDLQDILTSIIQARFPSLVKTAKTQIDQIKDVATLSNIIARVGSARTVKEARQALMNWKQVPQHD